MRIPAVAIAVAFAGGILLGRGLHLSHGVLGISFLIVFSLLIAALLFAWRGRIWAAAIFSLAGWLCLGTVGMIAASRPLPAGHVLSRIAAGQIKSGPGEPSPYTGESTVGVLMPRTLTDHVSS
jgi:hypothetical protein